MISWPSFRQCPTVEYWHRYIFWVEELFWKLKKITNILCMVIGLPSFYTFHKSSNFAADSSLYFKTGQRVENSLMK